MQIIELTVCNNIVQFCKSDSVIDGYTAIALGNFDGMHIGHHSVIQKLKSVCKAANLPCCVLLFNPHPVLFLAPHKKFVHLASLENRLKQLDLLGVEYVFILHFNSDVASLRAEDFFTIVLRDGLHASHIVTGYNFHFGHEKVGNSETLLHLANQHGICYSCVKKVSGEFFTVSSTKIKKLLRYGCVALVSKLLGRDYCIEGVVQQGLGIARHELDVYTANIKLHEEQYCYPARGVYLVRVECEGDIHHGIANIGLGPTVRKPIQSAKCNAYYACKKEDSTYLLEVHLFGYFGNLYGKKLHVYFRQFIRPERHFCSISDLRYQIKLDLEQGHYAMTLLPAVDCVCNVCDT